MAGAMQCFIKHTRRYAIWLQPTLFGEVSVIRQWGPAGASGGQTSRHDHPTSDAAVRDAEAEMRKRVRRGYGLVAGGATSARGVRVTVGVGSLLGAMGTRVCEGTGEAAAGTTGTCEAFSSGQPVSTRVSGTSRNRFLMRR